MLEFCKNGAVMWKIICFQKLKQTRCLSGKRTCPSSKDSLMRGETLQYSFVLEREKKERKIGKLNDKYLILLIDHCWISHRLSLLMFKSNLLLSGLIVLHVTFLSGGKDAVNTSFAFFQLTKCQLGRNMMHRLQRLTSCL